MIPKKPLLLVAPFFAIGFLAQLCQRVIIRELLMVFYGTELATAIILEKTPLIINYQYL
jgi:hypothetical protein